MVLHLQLVNSIIGVHFLSLNSHRKSQPQNVSSNLFNVCFRIVTVCIKQNTFCREPHCSKSFEDGNSVLANALEHALKTEFKDINLIPKEDLGRVVFLSGTPNSASQFLKDEFEKAKWFRSTNYKDIWHIIENCSDAEIPENQEGIDTFLMKAVHHSISFIPKAAIKKTIELLKSDAPRKRPMQPLVKSPKPKRVFKARPEDDDDAETDDEIDKILKRNVCSTSNVPVSVYMIKKGKKFTSRPISLPKTAKAYFELKIYEDVKKIMEVPPAERWQQATCRIQYFTGEGDRAKTEIEEALEVLKMLCLEEISETVGFNEKP